MYICVHMHDHMPACACVCARVHMSVCVCAPGSVFQMNSQRLSRPAVPSPDNGITDFSTNAIQQNLHKPHVDDEKRVKNTQTKERNSTKIPFGTTKTKRQAVTQNATKTRYGNAIYRYVCQPPRMRLSGLRWA